jgi:putative restriction endonuclease
MTSSSLSTVIVTRLEKAAADNGFDREFESSGSWLRFGSSHAPLEVWLSASDDGQPLAGLSRADVALELGEHGAMVAVTMPPGAQAVREVKDVAELHRLLRRAYQLARALPNELLHEFEKEANALPRTTEVERLVVQRVGQDIFRSGLLDYWEGRCAITGLAVPQLLRASHIKPWADCQTDAERLDVFNGLLLAAHLDAAFDGGFMTISEEGNVIVGDELPADARRIVGLNEPCRISRLADGHRVYLQWHRTRVFARQPRPPSSVGLEGDEP